MQADISQALSFEIKKELADRYFGFRTFIEQEKDELHRQARHCSSTVEQKICFDFVRLYIMLKDPKLIRMFFDLTGLDEDVFYDPYTVTSPTIRKKVFCQVKTRGLTKAARFKNLFLDSYDKLSHHVEVYREKVACLLLEHQTILEEIDIFYRNNDLGHIMGFLRSLDRDCLIGSDLHKAASGLVSPDHFEEKMKVKPPLPVDDMLSMVPSLPPLPLIKKELKNLAELALKGHNGQFTH